MTDTPGTLEERARAICAGLAKTDVDRDLFLAGGFDRFPEMRAALAALTEAADEIASLRARVEGLRGALREMVNSCIWGPVPGGDGETFIVNPPTTTALKRARQALKDTPNTFDISRQEDRMAAVGLKGSDNA